MSDEFSQVKLPEGAPEGFDRQEPRYGLVAIFGLATVVIVVAVIMGLQYMYDQVHEQQVFVKQEQPVSNDLLALHAREDGDLHSYRYTDRVNGVVRLPIDRAEELLAKEYAERRLPYSTKPKPIPPPNALPQPGGAQAGVAHANPVQK